MADQKEQKTISLTGSNDFRAMLKRIEEDPAFKEKFLEEAKKVGLDVVKGLKLPE